MNKPTHLKVEICRQTFEKSAAVCNVSPEVENLTKKLLLQEVKAVTYVTTNNSTAADMRLLGRC